MKLNGPTNNANNCCHKWKNSNFDPPPQSRIQSERTRYHIEEIYIRITHSTNRKDMGWKPVDKYNTDLNYIRINVNKRVGVFYPLNNNNNNN